MAGRSIGTVFLDYDVNFEPATRAQAKLLQDAKSTSLNIEQNWRNLGIKSGAEFDLMRQKIQNSYDMLASRFKSNAGEMLRIEQAKAEQLTRINEQQFGKQTSLLQTAKANWLALSAGAVAAWYTVSKGFDAVADTINTFTRLADEVRNLSYLTGETPEKVSGLIDVMGDLGVSTDTVQTSIAKMSTAIEKGSPSLDRLGISTRTAAGEQKNALEIFYESIDALGNVQNGLERNRLAQELFGRGWTQMIPIIEQGSAALKNMASESNKILTAEDLKRAREYQLALANLGDSWEAFKITVGQGIIAPITFVIKWLTPKTMTPEQAAAALKETQDWAAQFQTGPGGSGGLFGEGYAPGYGAYEDASLHGGGYRPPMPAGPTEQERKQYDEWAKDQVKMVEAQIALWEKENAIENELLAAGVKDREEARKNLLESELAQEKILQDAVKYGTEFSLKEREDAYKAEEEGKKNLVESELAQQRIIDEAVRLGADFTIEQEKRRAAAFAETAAGRRVAMEQALEAADLEAQQGFITFEEATRKKREIQADYYTWEKREADRWLRDQGDRYERAGNWFAASLKDQERAHRSFTNNMRNGMNRAFDEIDRSASDILFDGLTNGFKGMNDLVDDFGKRMLRVFTDILAAEATKSLLKFLSPSGTGSLLEGLGGILMSIGSAVGSFLGFFETGIWNVPREGVGVLHPGELVLPAELAAQFRELMRGGNGADSLGGPGRGPQAPGEKLSEALIDALNSIDKPMEALEYAFSEAFNALTQGISMLAAPTPAALAKAMFGGYLGSVMSKEQALQDLGFTKEQAAALAKGYASILGTEVMGQWSVNEITQSLVHDLEDSALGRAMRDIGLENTVASIGDAMAKAAAEAAAQAAERSSEGWGTTDVGTTTGPGATESGFGTSDTAGPSPFAAGALFTTRGPRTMIVGEAGEETVAVLRNPRSADTGGEIVIHNHLYIDGKEMTNLVVRAGDQGNSELRRVVRKLVR